MLRRPYAATLLAAAITLAAPIRHVAPLVSRRLSMKMLKLRSWLGPNSYSHSHASFGAFVPSSRLSSSRSAFLSSLCNCLLCSDSHICMFALPPVMASLTGLYQHCD